MNNNNTAILLTITSIGESLLVIKNEDSHIISYEKTSKGKLIKSQKRFSVINKTKDKIQLKDFNYLSISNKDNFYGGIFGFKDKFYAGVSGNGLDWKILKPLNKHATSAYLTPDYSHNDKKVVYWSGDDIHLGIESEEAFELHDDPIYSTHFDSESINILSVFNNNDEIYVPFSSKVDIDGKKYFSISLAIFEKRDPRKIKWRLPYPIWINPSNLSQKIKSPISIVAMDNKIYSFWLGKNEIYKFRHPQLEELIFNFPKNAYIKLDKADHNPILSPDPDSDWESIGVFNPATLWDDDEKKLHLLYRAVGRDWRSVFGYATSSDGLSIDSKNSLPCYVPRAPFEGQSVPYNPNSKYTSGPGAGGCEDPRLTKIDDKVYLTYVAYNGWTGPRLALSSITYDDFKNNNFNWSYPVLISKPGIIDKNAVIFPEKINGKYVIMHRVFPNILIDYVDSLDFDGNTFLEGKHKISPTKNGWDSRKIGAGPPPIKTKDGWLLIYHGVDDKKDHQYHVGAMILDKLNPTEVIARSSQPVISPTHWYENEGFKPGIVYPCGSAVIGENLNVYYGGSDSYVCVASTPLNSLLNKMQSEKSYNTKSFYLN